MVAIDAITVMNKGPLVHSRSVHLNLQWSVHSQYFSHTTNEKKEVNKSFSVKWPLNS